MSPGSSLGSLWFALVVTASLVAVPPTLEAAPARSPDASAPPHYPDAAHVYNGCHLSTLAYLARFAAEFPGEQGQALVLCLRQAGGERKSHTVSLISWRGSWWVRDEYFGVISLGCAVQGRPDLDRTIARVEPILEKQALAHMRRPGVLKPTAAPKSLSPEERARAVALAARMTPLPHTIFWLDDGTHEYPVVFFRPSRDEIAVYDPTFGTGVARCSLRDDAKVVALVAARLGYRVARVRPDLALAGGILLAAADAKPATLSQ